MIRFPLTVLLILVSFLGATHESIAQQDGESEPLQVCDRRFRIRTPCKAGFEICEVPRTVFASKEIECGDSKQRYLSFLCKTYGDRITLEIERTISCKPLEPTPKSEIPVCYKYWAVKDDCERDKNGNEVVEQCKAEIHGYPTLVFRCGDSFNKYMYSVCRLQPNLTFPAVEKSVVCHRLENGEIDFIQ